MMTHEEIISNIHRELHARTSVPVEAPAHIRHTGYLYLDEGENIRKEVKVIYEKVVAELGLLPSEIRREDRSCFVEKTLPNGNHLRFVWEMHSEFYTYTTIFTPSTKPTKRGSEARGFTLPTFPTLGKKVVDLDIMIIPGLRLKTSDRAFLQGDKLYGGKVVGGAASVWTSFYADENGQERIIVAGGTLSPGRLGRLVRRIIEIENYYHLILYPLPEYRDKIINLRKMEQRITASSSEIAKQLASGEIQAEIEQQWLVELTGDLANLIGLTEKMRFRFSAASSYYRIFEDRLKWLREVTGDGYQSLEEFLTARVSPAVRNYSNFIERAEALTSQLTALGNMIRTRINQSMERQNLKTLQAMDKRVELQIKLQKTVEGLSIIVLSYYLTGLAGYIFKAVEKLVALPGGSTTWTALTIPVWVIGSFLITHRAKKMVTVKELKIGKDNNNAD